MSPQTNVKISWFARLKRCGSSMLMDCCRASKSIKPYEGELWPNPDNFHWSHTGRRFDCTPVEAEPVQTQPPPNSNMRVPSQLGTPPVRVLSPGHPRLAQELPPLPTPHPPVKIRSSIEPSQLSGLRDGAISCSSSSRRQSFSTSGSNPSRRSTNEDDRFQRLNKRSLGPSILDEVLGIFDQASNIPYAVCGMAGLAAWGYTLNKPKHITIMVPPYCRDTITSWAKTVPEFETFSSRPDVIGVQTSDGRVVRINITYPDAADGVWEDYFYVNRLQLHGIGGFADVLRLCKLLNQAAVSYMEVDKVNAELMKIISKDIFWILWRIGNGLVQGEHNIAPLNPTEIPSVMDLAFWDSFVGAHPDASHKFAAAGLYYRLQPHSDVQPLSNCVPAPSNPYWQPTPPAVETVDPMVGSRRASMPARADSANTVRLSAAEKLKQRFQQPGREAGMRSNSMAKPTGPFRQSL